MRSCRRLLTITMVLAAAFFCGGCLEGVQQGAQQGLQSVVTTFVQELGTAIINLIFGNPTT